MSGNTNLAGETIICFNNEECIYAECRQFNTQLDTCNFQIIGLLGEPTASEPTVIQQRRMGEKPVGEQQQRVPELGDKTMIRDLKPGDKSSKKNPINIEGELVYDVEINETPTGKKVANPVLSDGTGQIRLTYWEKQTNSVKGLKKGDKIRVEYVWKVDEPYEGTAQAVPGDYSKTFPL